VNLREAWDAAAAEWIAWARTPDHDSYWRFHREAFLPLVPPPGELTLDIGCGEGRVARDLAAAGHRVIGLDGSAAMARAAASHHACDHPVIMGDAARLPLADEVADLAIGFMSFQDVDDLEAAIGEAGRVLQPGGRLLLAIVHPVNSAGRFDRAEADGSRRFVLQRSWYQRAHIVDVLERDGLRMTFSSEHRPLQDYTEALWQAGMLVERVREPTDITPGDKWNDVPMFLHILAVKPRR
jgi:SAM-dependent methyltransferase